MTKIVELREPDGFKLVRTLRKDNLDPRKVYEEYGEVVVYERGGERKLLGKITVDDRGKPFLEEVMTDG